MKPRDPLYYRKRRAAKKKRGECYHCSRPALPGTTRCLGCKSDEIERKHTSAEQGRSMGMNTVDREVILLLAAHSGLDPRTVKRAFDEGISSLKAEVARARLRAAAEKLGLKFDAEPSRTTEVRKRKKK